MYILFGISTCVSYVVCLEEYCFVVCGEMWYIYNGLPCVTQQCSSWSN